MMRKRQKRMSSEEALQEIMADTESDNEDFELDSDDDAEDDMDLGSSDNESFIDDTNTGQGAYANTAQWLRDFNQRCGPLIHDAEATPEGIFCDLLPDGFVDLLVVETNRYADQYFARVPNLLPKARARNWKPVTQEEMQAFLGISMYMGMVKLPTYPMYWSNEWMLDLGIKKVMSRDRFLLILSFLHCADNEDILPRGDPNYDRLFKIREVTDMFIASWQDHYYPSREISIDETVMGFSGNVSFLQYNPNKPHKWGITIWSLAESRTGYVYGWEVYTGKKSVPDPRCNNNDGRGAVHWITWDLMDKCNLMNSGHHLYMDNYFTSPTLFEDLADYDTGACGTLRRNRIRVPDVIKRAKPKKDDPPVMTKTGRCQFITWMDRNLVNLVTTVHTTSMFSKRTRSRNSPTGFVERQKPKAIQLYTDYMRGVDLADQAMWYSLNTHKSLKWWKKLFFGLLETTYTNSLVIWRKLHPASRLDRNQARMAIINKLINGFRGNGNRPGPAVAPQPELRFTPGPHYPEHFLERNDSGNAKRPDCIVCSSRNQEGGARHQVQYRCFVCKLPMCPWPCMQRYHTIRVGWRLKCTKDKAIHKPTQV